MPAFRFRGAIRAKDGGISTPLIDERIEAPDREGAIRLANSRDLSPLDEQVNALWLTDERGDVVWSLRRADWQE